MYDPLAHLEAYGEHMWRVQLNRVLHTARFWNSDGYRVFIYAKSGLIAKIERY